MNREQAISILRANLKIGGHDAWEGHYYYVDGIEAAANALIVAIQSPDVAQPSAEIDILRAHLRERDAQICELQQDLQEAEAQQSRPAAQRELDRMSRDDAESLVFDLLDAARDFDRAETGFRKRAREHYEEVRDKTINALTSPLPSTEKYSPEFVEEIKQADAAPPEAWISAKAEIDEGWPDSATIPSPEGK